MVTPVFDNCKKKKKPCIMKRLAKLELNVLFNRDIASGDCVTATELFTLALM